MICNIDSYLLPNGRRITMLESIVQSIVQSTVQSMVQSMVQSTVHSPAFTLTRVRLQCKELSRDELDLVLGQISALLSNNQATNSKKER